jgi:hypothetical protein
MAAGYSPSITMVRFRCRKRARGNLRNSNFAPVRRGVYLAAGGRSLWSIKDCSALQNESSVSIVFVNPAWRSLMVLTKARFRGAVGEREVQHLVRHDADFLFSSRALSNPF